MVKKIVFEHPVYGGLSISRPNYKGRSRPPDMTDDEFCEYVAQLNLRNAYHQKDGVYPERSFIEGEDYHIIEEDEIPEELFHEAWEWGIDRIMTNMPKARGMHMDRIRIARNSELAKKDIEFMRAIEAGDGSHKAIAAEKQVLRDIPQTFDLTTDTPEELKNKWPDSFSNI